MKYIGGKIKMKFYEITLYYPEVKYLIKISDISYVYSSDKYTYLVFNHFEKISTVEYEDYHKDVISDRKEIRIKESYEEIKKLLEEYVLK